MNGSAKVIASLVRGSIRKDLNVVLSDQWRDNSLPIESSPRVSQLVVAIWDPFVTQSVHGIRYALGGHCKGTCGGWFCLFACIFFVFLVGVGFAQDEH